jgi:hypothetical protein
MTKTKVIKLSINDWFADIDRIIDNAIIARRDSDERERACLKGVVILKDQVLRTDLYRGYVGVQVEDMNVEVWQNTDNLPRHVATGDLSIQ